MKKSFLFLLLLILIIFSGCSSTTPTEDKIQVENSSSGQQTENTDNGERGTENDITIQMSDYGNFEKVGELGFSLATNNKQIVTEAGDLILYQGNKFVIYYDTNSWNFTMLGKIKNISQDELKSILGDGDVTAVLTVQPSQLIFYSYCVQANASSTPTETPVIILNNMSVSILDVKELFHF